MLLAEQHYKLGGLATWFRRPGGHIFDVALHGFPVGMIKSCRRYWSSEIADSIVQLKDIRFDNPMFSLSTTFDRQDFTRLLVERFGVRGGDASSAFFDAARNMNFYDDQATTTGEMFERFFPGRERRDAAADGADHLRQRLDARRPGPDLRHRVLEFHVEGRVHVPGRHRPAHRPDAAGIAAKAASMSAPRCTVEKIHVAGRRVEGVTVGGRHDQDPGGRLQRQPVGHDLPSGRPGAVGRAISWSRPGRCG